MIGKAKGSLKTAPEGATANYKIRCSKKEKLEEICEEVAQCSREKIFIKLSN